MKTFIILAVIILFLTLTHTWGAVFEVVKEFTGFAIVVGLFFVGAVLLYKLLK